MTKIITIEGISPFFVFALARGHGLENRLREAGYTFGSSCNPMMHEYLDTPSTLFNLFEHIEDDPEAYWSERKKNLDVFLLYGGLESIAHFKLLEFNQPLESITQDKGLNESLRSVEMVTSIYLDVPVSYPDDVKHKKQYLELYRYTPDGELATSMGRQKYEGVMRYLDTVYTSPRHILTKPETYTEDLFNIVTTACPRRLF